MLFRQIGKGFCGSVWAADKPGPAIAMKREDGGPGRSVAQDSAMHQRIEHALSEAQATMGLAARVNCPAHFELIRSDDQEWWDSQATNFPTGYEHCNTLLTERILPLPRKARESLVDLFCPEKAKISVKKNRQDEDCLVRPYLGRRTFNAAPSRFFTLRNKPLCVNQLESIHLPIHEYATAMAETLAVIYWHSKTDANDIEFVLAPGREGEEGYYSPILGSHKLWVLDFDCVKELTHDQVGIDRAADAYMRNDPFWPRPGSDVAADQNLWALFCTRFLDSSALILGKESLLPSKFIEKLEQLGQARKDHMEALRTRPQD